MDTNATCAVPFLTFSAICKKESLLLCLSRLLIVRVALVIPVFDVATAETFTLVGDITFMSVEINLFLSSSRNSEFSSNSTFLILLYVHKVLRIFLVMDCHYSFSVYLKALSVLNWIIFSKHSPSEEHKKSASSIPSGPSKILT
jgi:hypothetical protein